MKKAFALVLICSFLMLACVATAEGGANVYNSKTEIKKNAPAQDQAFEFVAVAAHETFMVSLPVIVTNGVMYFYAKKSPVQSALPLSNCNGPPGYT